MKVFIIAEIGVNHNGKLSLAKKLIQIAKDKGADAVKFQSFKAEKLVSKNTPKVSYQKKNDKSKSHFEMIKKLELSENDFIKIKKFCKKINIEFISTPYDLGSARFLKKIGVNYFKTASADINDLFLHKYLSKTNKKVIVSTGMSTLKEVKNVAKLYKKKNLTLLHCVSNYPCEYSSINLNSLKLLSSISKIGYSDHSKCSRSAILSIALGARVIEKHFTINKNLPGPDHKASLNPFELGKYVEDIRLAEKILGKKRKFPQKEEQEMRIISRKSFFYKNDFKRGEKITLDHLKMLRPGNGLSFSNLKSLVNKKLKRNVKNNQMVKKNDFK